MRKTFFDLERVIRDYEAGIKKAEAYNRCRYMTAERREWCVNIIASMKDGIQDCRDLIDGI